MCIRKFLLPVASVMNTIMNWDMFLTMWKSMRTLPVLWNMLMMTGVSTRWQKLWTVRRRNWSFLLTVLWIIKMCSIRKACWCVDAIKMDSSRFLSHPWSGEMPLRKEIAGIIPGLYSTILKVWLIWWVVKKSLLKCWTRYLSFLLYSMTATMAR